MKPKSNAIYFNNIEDPTIFTATLNGESVTATKTKVGDLAVTIGVGPDAVQSFISPRTGAYGAYFMLNVGEQLFFLKEKTNSRGDYLQANPAKPRESSDSAPSGSPATYGARA